MNWKRVDKKRMDRKKMRKNRRIREKRENRENRENRDRSVDMLHGKLMGKLIFFALPIAASSMFQQLFNAADTAVVGRFADADALAAVGTNGEIVALLVSLSLGLSMGVNVLLAALTGGGREEEIPDAVRTSMLVALVLGIVGALLGQKLSAPLLRAIHTPESVFPLARQYLRLYFAGYPALLLYDFGSAILRAKGDSRRPFFLLILSGGWNVILNLFLVIVCGMGVAGVAIATDLSTLCAACLVVAILIREEAPFRLRFQRPWFCASIGRKILQIGIPAALQGAVFCFANLFVQRAVNGFGETAVSGSAIAMNFEYFGYYMITAFGQAATTFTSQNHAAGDRRRCNRILFLCLTGSLVFSAVILLPMIRFGWEFSGFFTSDPEVVRQSCLRIHWILAFEFLCSFYEIPAGFLRGMGSSTLPAGITIAGTCLFRVIWIETIFAAVHTLPCLFLAFPLSWLLTLGLMWGAVWWKHRKDSRKNFRLNRRTDSSAS